MPRSTARHSAERYAYLKCRPDAGHHCVPPLNSRLVKRYLTMPCASQFFERESRFDCLSRFPVRGGEVAESKSLREASKAAREEYGISERCGNGNMGGL
ncbi:hypothetical protein KM043_002638 [Ampulex compressa]|nr:hypothetical protein KM043_002638 [Ampulex compressa]